MNKFYHITPEKNLESILTYGLEASLPGYSGQPYGVYAFDNRATAIQAANLDPDDPHVVFEINGEDFVWEKDEKIGPAFYTPGDIPADHLRTVI